MTDQLANLFSTLQGRLTESLRGASAAISHPTAKGDAAEINWRAMMREHLPSRYQVDSLFVIDSRGEVSEQLDLVVYDRQYTPVLYNKDGSKIVPAESVYAVFEVKPTLTRAYLRYAGKKVASARRLLRTSTLIEAAGGPHEPKPPFPILGGLLALDCKWKPAFGETLRSAAHELEERHRIDLVCVAGHGTASISYNSATTPALGICEPGSALVYFLMKLLHELQNRGTVPAIDYAAYSSSLKVSVIDG